MAGSGPVYVGNASDISGGGGGNVVVTSSALPTGAATEATLAAANAKLTTTANGLKVDNSNVTQPVSGTFWQATQPVSAAALPLPSGAATEATLGGLAAKKYELKNHSAITPNDTTVLDYDYMYVGCTMATDGTVAPVNVTVVLQDDTSATYYNVPNGKEFIMDIKKVMDTGTSAGANIVCARIDRTS